MAVLRKKATILAVSVVLFYALIVNKITVLALIPRASPSQPKGEAVNENKKKSNKFLRPLSDKIIHVGNLDWQLPVHDVSSMITQSIAINLSENDKSEDISFDVKVAELPVPIRKRDEGKFHQGSATLSFSSAIGANLGMNALLQSLEGSYESGTTTTVSNWKVRWAFVPPSKENETKPQSEEVSPERMAHRKKRAEKYARKRRRVAEATDKVIESLLVRLSSSDRDHLKQPTPVLKAPLLDWKACPEEIDPMGGGKIRKSSQRGERKRAAVEAFLEVVRELLLVEAAQSQNRKVVADLGCGAGNLTVPLAWWLKQMGFGVLGVDINDQALILLSKRAERLGIEIQTLHADLLTLSSYHHNDGTSTSNDGLSECAAVVSLHACGAASDLSMAAAMQYNLPFVVSPCCIGKITTERTSAGKMPSLTSAQRSAAPQAVTYPRSAWLRTVLPSEDDYKMLASAADYGVGNSSCNEVDHLEMARRKRCKLSKKIIETDRLQWAEENGYCIRLLEMPRIGPLYPKRELLLGAKEGSREASILRQLPTIT